MRDTLSQDRVICKILTRCTSETPDITLISRHRLIASFDFYFLNLNFLLTPNRSVDTGSNNFADDMPGPLSYQIVGIKY